MKKRLWSSLLAVCLIVSLLPTTVLAEENEQGTQENPWDISAEGEGNNVTAYLTVNSENSDNPTYTLTISGTGDMKDFDVGTGSGTNKAPWFTKLENATTSITAVTIGDGVTSIGNYALSKLSNLKTINGNDTSSTKSIVFPAQLTSWGYSLNGTGFTGILSFPENCRLEDEGSLTIFGNNNITGVNWTNYPLTSIPAHWTEYGTAHTALTDLGLDTIPSTVTTIGEYAFKNYKGTSIVIPDTSIQYGKGAFVNTNLTEVTINVEKENSALSESMFSTSKDLTTVTFVGNNLKKIPAGAFHDTKLSYLAIPYGVTNIDGNSSTSTEHASTLGLGSNSASLDTQVVFVFPSTLSSIEMSNNLDELFSNRSASNVYILAPTSLEWGNLKGGIKGLSDDQTITGLTNFYQYTLATTATYGDTVNVFSVTGQTEESTNTLPKDFGTISYMIEDESVLSGELKAISTGKTKVEIFITKPDTDTKTKIAETTITVSPKEVSVNMSANTAAYDGNTKTLTATAGTGTTLPSDLTLVYSYSSDNGSTYDRIPPSAPGTYTVKVESGNANYTLTGTTIATLTISAPSGKTNVSDATTVTGPASLVYDGAAKAYTAAYEGINQWTIVYYDADSNKLESAPVNAGSYTVTINGIGESVYASITRKFTITPATLTITPNNKTAYVGDTLPTLGTNDYTVTGLVGTDTLSKAPTLAYDGTPDMNTANTYAIKSSGAEAGGNYTITYVDGTLTVYAYSSGSSTSSPSSSYPVSAPGAKNGDVTVSPKTAKKGDTVTITVTPDKGYTLETLTVLDKNGSELTLTDKGNGQYTFIMPDGKVEVRAMFMDDNTMLNHFVDVQADDYYYDAVLWAVKNGITKGVSDTDFGPELACTRAQIVTFLWRAAGSPEPKNAGSFADVSADSYYAKAVAWAVENGITGGTGDGQFSPDAACTREQAVAFLYRASGSPAVSGGRAFGDVAADAYYANAVTWAEQNGVTGGIGGGLFGSGNDCTRAQIVTFLYRAYQGK